MGKIRYYNENVGPIKDSEISAFKKAISLCNDLHNIDEVIMLIHTKKNTGYLERIFGTRNLNSYFKGIRLDPKYPIFKIETIKTFDDTYGKKRILLCFGLKSKELFKYDDFDSANVIIAHQWSKDEVKDWAKAWKALNIENDIPIEKTDSLDKVVKEAFKDLTSSINLITGITHPSDNETCKTYLRALNKYGFKLDSDEVFSHLITELNWAAENANDVIKLIDKLNSGKYFIGGEKTGLHKFIKKWNQKINT